MTINIIQRSSKIILSEPNKAVFEKVYSKLELKSKQPVIELAARGVQGLQGIQGEQGAQGIQGIQGEAGEGVVAGGTAGQFLSKASNADFDTFWDDVPNPDLSGYVPYTGATASVDLNGQELNNFSNGYNTGSFTFLNGGVVVDNNGSYAEGALESTKGGFNNAIYTTDGTNSVGLSNGSQAINAVGDIVTANNVTANNVTATYLGSFGATHTAILGDDGVKAAGFTDGTNTVEISNNTWSIDAVGNADITGALNLLDSSSSLIIGDIGGDARGVGAIDIQQSRTASTQVASGQDSTSFGKNNTASGRNAIAIGTNNLVSTLVTNSGPPFFTPGDQALQTGVAVGSNNSISASSKPDCYAVAVGRSNTCTQNQSTAVGLANTASGSSATAIGSQNTASGILATAIGVLNTASSNYSFAYGYANSARAVNSFGVGQSNQVLGTNSFSIGSANSVLGSTKCNAIGANLAPVVSNTTFIGSDTGFITITDTSISTFGNETPNERLQSTGNILATNITSLGAEKITNGTFTGSATSWTVGSFAYSANKITKTADGTSPLLQPVASMVTPLVVGETYLLTFTTSNFSVGTITISCGGVTVATIAIPSGGVLGSRTFSYIFKCISAVAPLTFTPSNTSRITTLDNVSLKKIAGGDLIGLGSLYLGQDDTNRMQISVGSTGAVTLNANGAGAEFLFSDSVRFNGGTKSSDGSAGFTGTGAYTNFTIKNGLITAAS